MIVVDKVAPISTDLLNGDVRSTILSDLRRGHFDALGIATPCETLSPLRESPPGPRPLRSLEWPNGLPAKQRSKSEQKQLKDHNELIEFSAEAAQIQSKLLKPFWLENPDHRDKLDLWKVPCVRQVVNTALITKTRFDQCRVGAEVTKPTILAHYGMSFDSLNGLHCNRKMRVWKKKDGSEYKACHESLVHRWRQTSEDKWERASKALAEYTPEFNKVIAEAMLNAEGERIAHLRQGNSSA